MTARNPIDIARLTALINAGNSQTVAARALGCSQAHVARACRAHGLHSGSKRGGWQKPNAAKELPCDVTRADRASGLRSQSDAAFAARIARIGGRFEDDPRLTPGHGLGPKPLPLPAGRISGCGNAAIMCLS